LHEIIHDHAGDHHAVRINLAFFPDGIDHRGDHRLGGKALGVAEIALGAAKDQIARFVGVKGFTTATSAFRGV
jgi:hypothetical protein